MSATHDLPDAPSAFDAPPSALDDPLQELIGEAEVRGRRVIVRWVNGRMEGDPELVERLERVTGRCPASPAAFLSALRVIEGHMLYSGAAVTAPAASIDLSASTSGTPLLDA